MAAIDVGQGLRGRGLVSFHQNMEKNMGTGEVYYLVLVCSAFGAFAVALAASTIRYWAWIGRDTHKK